MGELEITVPAALAVGDAADGCLCYGEEVRVIVGFSAAADAVSSPEKCRIQFLATLVPDDGPRSSDQTDIVLADRDLEGGETQGLGRIVWTTALRICGDRARPRSRLVINVTLFAQAEHEGQLAGTEAHGDCSDNVFAALMLNDNIFRQINPSLDISRLASTSVDSAATASKDPFVCSKQVAFACCSPISAAFRVIWSSRSRNRALFAVDITASKEMPVSIVISSVSLEITGSAIESQSTEIVLSPAEQYTYIFKCDLFGKSPLQSIVTGNVLMHRVGPTIANSSAFSSQWQWPLTFPNSLPALFPRPSYSSFVSSTTSDPKFDVVDSNSGDGGSCIAVEFALYNDKVECGCNFFLDALAVNHSNTARRVVVFAPANPFRKRPMQLHKQERLTYASHNKHSVGVPQSEDFVTSNREEVGFLALHSEFKFGFIPPHGSRTARIEFVALRRGVWPLEGLYLIDIDSKIKERVPVMSGLRQMPTINII